MKSFAIFSVAVAACAAQVSLAADYTPPRRDLGFPIYTNKPSGKQISGQHAPASTPALSPEEAQKKFTLPPGFEIRLFASEPEVVNPVAMTWDERGRLWVVELYEYPLGAKPGEKGRDRIKILEDTDGDGKADKVTVFADGLSLATGLLLGNGGAYVGQAPDLLFLEDTKGNGKADKRTVLKTGFGLHDRHELLNGFTWGPDGYLYLTHGVFTLSQVKDPNLPNDSGVTVNAAVARFHPLTRKFEVFADGTSNPWGVDFDRVGNAFLSACVIDHMFHMAPGGQYVRQGGTPGNPYAYQLLPSIVDHRHHMAAYAGIQVYQGDQYPEEYRGTIFCGNIHDNAVHQDRLTPNGSSFKSSFIRDFVRANDGWFMPVSQQIGPDGCLWIMDWYDKYPCYQNANADPEGVDREHGRIWRVVYTGKEKGKPVPPRPELKMDLGKLSNAQLVALLAHPNVWQRKMAQRLLTERFGAQPMTRENLPTAIALQKMLADGRTLEARLAALWTLHGTMILNEVILDKYVEDKEPVIRTWVARLTGERGTASEAALIRLDTLAKDAAPSVRLAVATACRQFVSSSLTVNTPVITEFAEANVGKILATLVEKSADGNDPLIPFMIWMASEPKIAANPQNAFNWLARSGPATMPLSGQLAYKTMRRVCDLQNAAHLDAAVDFLMALPPGEALLAYALNGLVDGQKGKALRPNKSTAELFTKLLASPRADVVSHAQRLGALWGDATAMQSSINLVNDAKAAVEERIKAVQAVRQLKNDAARTAMVKLLAQPNPEALAVEAVRALGEIGGDTVGDEIVKQWKTFSPATRRAAAEVLASRSRWALALLAAIEAKTVSASEIPMTVIRTLGQSGDEAVRKRAASTIGRIRPPDTDKLKLMADKKKMILNGAKPDLKAGYELAKKTCFNCHKLHGEGADIGPDLTGVGRSTLDALLANVIDPNQIIGKGYENVEVETKDGRSISGRLVEDTNVRVKLISAGPKEDVIARSDIAKLRVSEISVMPEGLEQMPDEDFRNLIAFILNPPGDQQPFSWHNDETPAPPKKSAAAFPRVDRESVALWNPEWKVIAPDFEGAPRKLTEFAGRKNVLMTHPFDREKASALERTVLLVAGQKTTLTFAVAAHDQGDWELRVLADGKLLHKQLVDKTGERWKRVSVDLSPFAGKQVTLRLENAANDWSFEFGYWSDVELKISEK